MMEFRIHDEENLKVAERYELVKERIMNMSEDKHENIPEFARDYFTAVSGFCMKLCGIMDKALDGSLYEENLETLKKYNEELFGDVTGDNYLKSYANPEYAYEMLGSDYSMLLSVLYAGIRKRIFAVYSKDLSAFTRYLELMSQVYFEMEQEECTPQAVKNCIYYNYSDYADIDNMEVVRALSDSDCSYILHVIKNMSLDDDRYMYLLGRNITENETGVAQFLRKLPQEKIDEIAKTFTEGYRKGFIAMRIDMSVKEFVDLRYPVGFEKVIIAAMKQFEEMGLKCLIRNNCVSSTPSNKQYGYDHRFDYNVFLDKALIEREIDTRKVAFEEYKDKAFLFAGPACIESFGENPFEPEQTPHQIKLDENQRNLMTSYRSKDRALFNQYIPGDTTSFTIVAYPIPEIGDNFVELFEKTMEINNLDSDLYQKIQATIIDTLDKGDYVHVLGRGGNKTDIKVNLWKLKNPEKETIFENCVADVNIPVGEVFTSPVLKGTNGVLNVSSVYLNDLKYTNLSITFEDGMIKDYSCDNFEDEKASKEFIRENLMVNRDTLPIGEFAIGTNTTAYVIANKYDIVYKLPILIVEKMGPHFAVGDTCYSYSEEHVVYNPDGKEIVARENECSALRNENPEKAYFNCHTDITIPYDEIGKISVITKDGEEIFIIKDGRFVLPGCEELNRPFD